MKINFFDATKNDIDTIILLAELAWKPTYAPINSEEQNNYMFNIWYSKIGIENQMNEGQKFWLMKFEDNYCGYASYTQINNFHYTLNKIYILPNLQGLGLGKKFLQFIEENLKLKNAKELLLNVNRNNSAISFYKACGYTIIESVDIPLGEYWMNDFVMSKLL